jgi:HTH-type transcriptional regulator / antitoxin HipB
MTERSDTFDRAPDLAQQVAQRRRALGLTQQDLAELAEVSHRFVQSLEAGKATVRLDKVRAVLTVLGLSLAVVPSKERHE